jgi:hypothetical protein
VTKTVAGDLTVVEIAFFQAYELRLGGKAVAHTDIRDPKEARMHGFIPKVARLFDGLAPYDQVALILWWNPGNMCEGWRATFLGLRKDGSYALSEDIVYCGAAEEVVTVSGQSVTFTIPEGPPHHPAVPGALTPVHEWEYRSGTIRQIK